MDDGTPLAPVGNGRPRAAGRLLGRGEGPAAGPPGGEGPAAGPPGGAWREEA